jgi:hypothetical protein
LLQCHRQCENHNVWFGLCNTDGDTRFVLALMAQKTLLTTDPGMH